MFSSCFRSFRICIFEALKCHHQHNENDLHVISFILACFFSKWIVILRSFYRRITSSLKILLLADGDDTRASAISNLRLFQWQKHVWVFNPHDPPGWVVKRYLLPLLSFRTRQRITLADWMLMQNLYQWDIFHKFFGAALYEWRNKCYWNKILLKLF